MSDTTTPTQPKAPAEPLWAKPSIGIYSLGLFLIALAVAWWAGDKASFQLLVGAIIANSTQVMNYYFGSSSGSDRKTEMIAQSVPPSKP